MRTLEKAGSLAGKKVLVRDDFNITIDNSGKILDDFRIRASLPTIKYLLEQQAKIILMSHFGRPEGDNYELRIKNKEFSLKRVAERIEEILGQAVKLLSDCVGDKASSYISQMKNGNIALLENLRFHPEEEANNEEFAKQLASLAEIYVNDAFGASHRAHASIDKITSHLPSFAGLLLEKEVRALSLALEAPARPFVVVIGGAKISTKMKLIEEYLKKADHVILGGALANTVLHAQGIAVGSSFVEEGVLPQLQKFNLTDTKLHIPVDVVASQDKTGKEEGKIEAVGKTGPGEIILDIGPETEKVFNSVIKKSKMVVWNGPMGLFEIEKFSHGTKAMAASISGCPSCFSIVGGGETTCFVEKIGLIDKFSHVSTGGGAMLEFLAGDKLPGIEALK